MNRTLLIPAVFCVLSGCSKTDDEQMQEYMEFYYPSTGQYTYEIVFDWGVYVITTGAGTDESLHPDSEPYRGYIVMRPYPKGGSSGPEHRTYLITPEGAVWTTAAAGIAEVNTREEIVAEKTEYGTSTQTTIVESPLEPVVEHFKANEREWIKYGSLESGGGGYKFKKST